MVIDGNCWYQGPYTPYELHNPWADAFIWLVRSGLIPGFLPNSNPGIKVVKEVKSAKCIKYIDNNDGTFNLEDCGSTCCTMTVTTETNSSGYIIHQGWQITTQQNVECEDYPGCEKACVEYGDIFPPKISNFTKSDDTSNFDVKVFPNP